MNRTEKQLRDVLARISELASIGENGGYAERDPRQTHISHKQTGVEPTRAGEGICTGVRSLPSRLLERAAEHAKHVNPVNAPLVGPIGAVSAELALEPLHLTLLTSKYWGPSPRTLTVSFMEATPDDLRNKILSHMNAWTRTACISFKETQQTGDVRISREPGGYWSYLGTDIKLVPQNRQTMNLERFSMSMPDSEFYRVVRHETGHTLGFPHEHMRRELVARIDPEKAYSYFWKTQRWDRRTVDQQVLTSLDERSIIGTPPDETSIMCYQLPGAIMRDGHPILGGADINQTDYQFAGRIYPKTGVPQISREEGWDESEDVMEEVFG